MTLETDWFVVVLNAVLGALYLFKAIDAQRSGRVTAQARFKSRTLDGQEAARMLFQWWGGGILLIANVSLTIFFPLIGVIIWLVLMIYLIVTEATAV